MKNLRIEKLSELRKIAAGVAPPPIAPNAAIVIGKYIDRINQAKTNGEATSLFNKAMKNLSIPAGSPEATTLSNAYSKKIKQLVTATGNNLKQYPKPTMAETKGVYIARAKAGGSMQSDNDLGIFYDSMIFQMGGGTAHPTGGGSGGGSSEKVLLTAPVGTVLREIAANNEEYAYTIISPTSFSYTTKSNPTPITVTSTGFGKWDTAANTLNELYKTQSPSVAATPAAAAAPATTGATTNPAATGPDQVIVSKIAKVLTVGMTKPLAIATAGDEIKQITEMSTFLDPKGGIMALASIIASKVGGTLGALNAADIATVSKAGQKELAINRRGQFAADTAVIMRQVNLLYKAFLDNKQSLNAYWEKKASVSLDKKFIKAATLRRMRIRSQMEAAVDSSAQMGRSRVF